MTRTTAPVAGVAIVRRPRRLRSLWLLALLGVLLASAVLSITVGARDVGWSEILAALGGGTDGFDQAAIAKRIPRTLLAILVGAALAVAGTAMQGATRNPIADPGILGVTMGANLAVVIGLAYFGITSASGFIWVAILGAAVSAAFVYTIASLGRGGATPLKLALSGAATSAALVSLVTSVVLPRADIADAAQSWHVGGVGGATMPSITLILPFVIVGALICVATSRGLNSLALGDDLAAGLGERVAVIRLSSAFGAVILCGAATAIAGPIAFVGLVVPHACRLIVGPDYRWLMPFSAVAGAVLLTIADVVGRIVARPSEVDVGIITALIGAPFFIAIVRRQKVREL